MAVAKFGSVVLDCPDPRALADFYIGVLGGRVKAADDQWIDIEGYEGTALSFQKAPGHVPPKWPTAEASQQFHLDLDVVDLDAAEAEVLALGATLLEKGPEGRTWRVYGDPAGHPFCLCVG
ncbi:VOC family protein [Streptomyces beijiangensis]|uniref:VOC family protein n=1 Tax=Streptomyces beijiangensis TaxID=163361 RepID=A0A939JFB9_9ACTN|nr:VOC family protein [Streptomyces beijiangensis]MBO0510347.1 VOC family protein [Streptomyces beijiangensis]